MRVDDGEIEENGINAKAKLTLKMFDIVPKNSMAFGLGATILLIPLIYVNDVTYSRNFVMGLRAKNYTFVSELLFATEKYMELKPVVHLLNSIFQNS